MTHASLHRCLRIGLCALVCGAALYYRGARAAGENVALAPHRAVYELTLASARSGQGMASVAGRMVYDLVGSACEGYTQNMRFVTRMSYQSGNTTVADLRSSTWEDGLGKRFPLAGSSKGLELEGARKREQVVRRPAFSHDVAHPARCDRTRPCLAP